MLEENQAIMYYCALTPKNLLYYRKFCAITVSNDLISVWPISFFTNSTTYNYPYIARTRAIFIAITIARFKVKLSTFKEIVSISFNESLLKMMKNALGLFQDDVTRLRGRGYPKLVIKSDIWGGVHANSDITTKKYYVQVFIFYLILFGAAAAELWLPFRWGMPF